MPCLYVCKLPAQTDNYIDLCFHRGHPEATQRPPRGHHRGHPEATYETWGTLSFHIKKKLLTITSYSLNSRKHCFPCVS